MDINRKYKGFAAKTLLFLILLLLQFYPLIRLMGQVPPPVRIEWLSVNPITGNIEIQWEKSADPSVNYYTVCYQKISGTIAKPSWDSIADISVAASADPFVSFSPDLLEGADIYQKPVAFAIEAHVDAIIHSDVDGKKWDSTILLKASFDPCLAELKLNWNTYDYNMWPGGTAEYQLFMAVNGEAYSLYRRISCNDTSCILRNDLIANNAYKFYIAAISGRDNSISATSTVDSVYTNMARLPDYIYADFATNYNNNAQLRFSIDSLGGLSSYNLMRSPSANGPWDSIIQLQPVNSEIIYIDKIDYNSGPYYYMLQAINECKVAIDSSDNIASTIVLKNSGEVIRPELSWNEYRDWANGVRHYILERRFGNNPYALISESSVNYYTDNEIASLIEEGYDANVCYRVTASEMNNPYGQDNQSVSNEVCIELPLNIRFEFDAFIPGGLDNNSFGPTIDFLPDEFIFEILNRSERVVYHSENPLDCRWDGLIDGKLAPEGAYMYILQYKSKGSTKHILRGGVAVVYP